MESKVALLEQRLNLVELFMEMKFCESYRDFLLRCRSTANSIDVTVTKTKRVSTGPPLHDCSKLLASFLEQRFCESFREFTVRHLSSQSYSSGGGSTSISNQSSTPTASTRPKSRTTSRSSTATAGATTAKRELRIRVVRLEDTKVFPSPSPPTPPSKTPKISNDSDNHRNSAWSPVHVPSPFSGLNDNFEETSKKDDQGNQADGGDDNYFTFPFEENEVDEGANEEEDDPDPDPIGTSTIDPDDQNWSETSSSTDSEFGKKSKPSSSKYKTKTRKLTDLRRNGEERKLKCGYPPCDKAFFEKKHLAEHERMHQKDKWVECRVEGCGSSWKNNSKRLYHERRCIVKRLREDKYVDPKVIEDVRRRSLKLREDPFKEFKMLPELEVDEEGRPLKKKKKEPSYAYKEDMAGDILNGEKRICPFCKEHWNVDVFEGHVQSHVRERTFKCGICGKGFFSRKAKCAHERIHDKDKSGLRCRVGGGGDEGEWCRVTFTDRYNLTVHERGCVRRALEKGREVAEEEQGGLVELEGI